MIVKIVKKEFSEYLRDGLFRWMTLIIISLLLVSLSLGWKNYASTKREIDSARADSHETWGNQCE